MLPEEKLNALLVKATANFEAQKAKNDAIGIELTALVTKHTSLQAEFDKLKEVGDSNAMQKMAETIEALQGKMEGVMSKLVSPARAIATKEENEAVQHIAKKAIGAYFKSGKNEKRADFTDFVQKHAETQFKALNITDSASGGLAVAQTLDRDVLDYAKDFSVISTLVMHKNSLTRDYRQLIRITEPGISEGIEAVAGTTPAETSTQIYTEVEVQVFKLYAQPRITNEALLGTDIHIYSELVSLLGEEAGVYLNAQLLYGNGTGKNARGILSSNRIDITNLTGKSFLPTKTSDGTGARSPEYFPVFATGVDGALGTSDKLIVDWLIDYMSALNKRYRAGAKFVMNENTYNVFKKLRDGDENPILVRDYINPGAMLLMGKPVELDETMPDIASDSTPIIYGDLSKAYAYNSGDIDQLLLDPYTKKGSLIVYMEKEYFEMIQRSDAIIVAAMTTNGLATA